MRKAERDERQFFVKQTFGETLVRKEDQTSSAVISLPPTSDWRKQGDLSLEEHDGTTVLSIRSSLAGAVIPFPAKETEIYALRFKYSSPQSFSVQEWDVDDQLDRLENVSLHCSALVALYTFRWRNPNKTSKCNPPQAR